MRTICPPGLLLMTATILFTLSGCMTPTSGIGGNGTCGGEAASTQSVPRGGAPAGSPCSDFTQCAEASCDCGNGSRYFAAACVNGVCDNSGACACVEQQLATQQGQNVCAGSVGPSTCSGASQSAQAGPRAGAPMGSSCTDSSQCAEASCDCANGSRYFAASCVNGVCDNSQACACVESQLGGNACAVAVVTQSTCSGASGAAQPAPRGGFGAGAACTDSSQCAQVACDCADGNVYFASACTLGFCDPASACSCVEQQLLATTGVDACS